ncbi:MAG: dephospho-CoA kinase [Planctomycetota bacterium]|nr:dephospho-CoA kinase [Planctomycetota bacterium]
MKVIGLLGGIGSGKSTIAQQLMELGAHKIDADKVGHEILSDEDVRHAVKNRWGEFVFDENGWIDRARLAKMVFGNAEGERSSLADLEAITHPRIRAEIQRRLQVLRDARAEVVILDAPVLIKAGWDHLCDELVFIECPLATRLRRVEQRGWSAADLESREAAQTSLDEKRSRCNVSLDNSKDTQHAFRQVEELFDRWTLDANSDIP